MYKFYNANPNGKLTGDCVKRAISKAANMDYNEVKRQLNRYKKITGAATFNESKNCYSFVEKVLKAERISFPAVKGEHRMNGVRFCNIFTQGNYILSMANHWTCCVDGIIYDTWDCSEKCVYQAWKLPV